MFALPPERACLTGKTEPPKGRTAASSVGPEPRHYLSRSQSAVRNCRVCFVALEFAQRVRHPRLFRATMKTSMADHEVEPSASTGKMRLGKIAAYVAGFICVLALLIVAEWNMKPGNPLAQIRDECRKNHGNLGPTRLSECLSELVMRRYGRGSYLPLRRVGGANGWIASYSSLAQAQPWLHARYTITVR
jgi:hypothetical protein